MTCQRVSFTIAMTSRLRTVVRRLAHQLMNLVGVYWQLPRVAFRRVNSSARPKIVGSSGSQMLCSDTLHLQYTSECVEESRALAERVLPRADHFVPTDGNVAGTQGQTAAAGSSEQPSRKWRTQRLGNTKWRVSEVSYELETTVRQRTDGTRRGRFPSERGGRKRRAGGGVLE